MRPKSEISIVMPKIGKFNGSVCVFYKVRNPQTEKLETYRIHKGFSRCENDVAKKKLADKIIKDYSDKLRHGWLPWANDDIIYVDQTQYAYSCITMGNKRRDGSQIRRYISIFIEEKKLLLSKKTIETYISKLRIFTFWLERNDLLNLKIYELTPTVIHNFARYLISERKLDKLSVEKYQQNLTQFFKWCKEKKLISEIPTEKMPIPPKNKDMGARPISDVDMDKLLEVIHNEDTQLFLACMFQYFLCCRPGSELRLMKIEDINLFTKTVHITESNGKTGARSITMPEALIEICKSYNIFNYDAKNYVFGKNGVPDESPVSVNQFSTRFRKFRDRLKLSSSYKFYSFKHTAAGKLLESGATIVEVKDHLGHRDFESTIRYIKRHFGSKSEKVAQFKPDFLKGFI